MNYIVTAQKQPVCYSRSKFNGLLLGAVLLNANKLFESASTCTKVFTLKSPSTNFDPDNS